ncbi:MAG TPA: ABC transporter ATP-binding protein [Chthonomonadaceae bacterium]|nr:ABC transporter ATP-binding protein [Chthonomonadaceae bacterium]
MAILSVRGVTKRFQGRNGGVKALEDIWLDVDQSEFLILVGPSGCGKSTLLNIIARLEFQDEGEVLMNGQRVVWPGRDRTMVFQDGALFPWLTVQKNVEFGLKRMGVKPRERAERALHYLKLVRLSKFAGSYLHELSGGMRQRVAIARALAVEPQVLLMDEPFSALDALTREDLYEELQDIWQRLGTTVVFVTHNVREAITLGDRVVLLSGRPGRIQEIFPVDILRPRHIDDVDVARMAQQISHAMKSGHARMNEEEYDEDEERTEEIDLLRLLNSSVGHHR